MELLDGFGSQLLMTGCIISLDGKEIIKGTDPIAVGEGLAEKIISLGGDRILREIKVAM